MADKVYALNFTLSDGTTQTVSFVVPQGDKGDKGDTGKTAYQYAKDGGYTGTEAEFMAQLVKEIPTKLSQLTNDSNFITSSGAPVQSVAGKKGAVTLTPGDVGADASGTAASAVSTHDGSNTAHSDIRELITGLTNRLNTLANSDDTTLDQMAELVAYIKANRGLIESITTDKVNVADIVNNLTTNVTNKPLSAAQGVAIKGLIDSLNTAVGKKLDASALPTAVEDALAAAKESGEFDGSDGTSVTVKNVTESTADGGSNVVTFSDGKTVTIKNGSKGSAGTNGTSVTVTNVSSSTADGGNNVVTFSDGKTLTVKNGTKGSTGSKGDKGDKGTGITTIAIVEL